MKRILGLIFIVLSLTSCAQLLQPPEPELNMRDTVNHFSTLEEAGNWISDNIEYHKPVPYNKQSPYQTETNRYGNCADMVTLLIWYARDLGYNVRYMSVTMFDGQLHALAIINGVIYNAETFTVWTSADYLKVNGVWTLDEVLLEIQEVYGNRCI